jgi:hypothetical protein
MEIRESELFNITVSVLNLLKIYELLIFFLFELFEKGVFVSLNKLFVLLIYL